MIVKGLFKINCLSNEELVDFSSKKREEIDKENTWKIEDIYENIDQWKKDIEFVNEEIKKTEDLKHKWTSSSEKMFLLLDHLNTIELKLSKLYSYINCQLDTEMSNTEFQTYKGEIHTIYVNFSSMLSFINPDIIKLGDEKIKKYIEEKQELRDYDKMFGVILRVKDHVLDSEKEEISSLTGLFSGTMGKASSVLNDVEMTSPKVTLSNGEEIDLNYNNYVKYRTSKNINDRNMVMKTFWENHDKFKNTFAALLDGNIKKDFFQAKIHKYKDCLTASLYGKAIDNSVYLNLIKKIRENLKPLHKYLKLKEKLLKLNKISYGDIYASSIPAVDRKFKIEEGKSLIIDSLKPLGNEYLDVLKQGFEERWMDIYPNKDKRSGAYSNGSVYEVHPYVLLNYNYTYNAVTTLTHEYGHALHSYFSNKNNCYQKADYPIFLAEIASTFNETMLIDYLIKNENDKTFKMYLIDQQLENLRATLYRQTLFAEFEYIMHSEVEKGGTLTYEWLDSKYLELTRFYYGHDENIMDVNEYIKNEWSVIPHFYYNFYVYQYSTGVIAAMDLAYKVQNNEDGAVEKYLEFLKSGGKDYPLNTLKKAGVDLTTNEPYQNALKKFETLVDELEKLSNE